MQGSIGVRPMFALGMTFAFTLMSCSDFFKAPGNAACFFGRGKKKKRERLKSPLDHL